MDDTERKQIKGALLKCAKENENKITPTCYVIVSSVCRAAVERIEELEQQIEKMKCCQNCKSEDNDYMEKPCCECSRCLGDIKRKGTSDKWEIKENGI